MTSNQHGAARPGARADTTRPGATRRTGLLLALGTACISGVAVFLNSYGVKAFGDATTYTTAKNVIAALVLAALVGAISASRDGSAVLTRPSRRGWWRQSWTGRARGGAWWRFRTSIRAPMRRGTAGAMAVETAVETVAETVAGMAAGEMQTVITPTD